MPIPTLFTDLSTTPSSNSPAGSESPTDGDGYLRTAFAMLRSIMSNSGNGWTSPYATTGALAALPTLDSGTYTPTATGTDNVASATGLSSKYMRIGSMVHVSGAVTIDPTSASVLTAIRLSLPIASDFTTATDCTGVASRASSDDSVAATITAGTVNNDAVFSYLNDASVSSLTHTFEFTYEIK